MRGDHLEPMRSSPTTALLVTAEPILREAVEAAALALDADLVVADDPAEARRRWGGVETRLLGADLVAALAEVSAGASDTYIIGSDPETLVRASAELSLPVLRLPQDQPKLATILASKVQSSAKIVSLSGVSGGLGVSSTAVALSCELAKRGLRAALVELVAGGGIDLLFGAETRPGWRWSDLAAARGELGDVGDELLKAESVSILAMGREPGSAPEDTAVMAVLTSLARSYDYVVVDSPAGWQAPAGFLCVEIVLVGGDVRGVAAAQQAGQLGSGSAGLAVRVGPGRDIPAQSVADAVGLPLIGNLRADPTVPKLAATGDCVGVARRLRSDVAKLANWVVTA